MEFLQYYLRDQAGVYRLSSPIDDFEDAYLSVRRSEARLYSDDEVKRLPYASQENPNRTEWQLRQQSFRRLVHYLQTLTWRAPILDLGAGNGWLTAHLHRWTGVPVLGLDVNHTELTQAERCFGQANVRFAYGDVFEDDLPDGSFQIVVCNSVIQYFASLPQLLDRLLGILTTYGEIHILDSPLYTLETRDAARARSRDYFLKMGETEMAAHYHHHTWQDLDHYPYEILYRPSQGFYSKLMAKMGRRQNPFAWVKIRRPASSYV